MKGMTAPNARRAAGNAHAILTQRPPARAAGLSDAAAELLQAIRAQRRARAAQAFEDNGFEGQGFED